MWTTLVGSFPLSPGRESIERALEDQAELGVTHPVLPQLRNFVLMYIEPLLKKGVVVAEGPGYVLRGDPAAVEPEPPEDLVEAADIAADMGLRYRVAFTGPFTIASELALPRGRPGDLMSSALSSPEHLEAVVEYTREMAREVYSSVKGFVYCVDEPVLSVVAGSRRMLFNLTADSVREVLDSVLGRFRAPYRGVHVCARLPPLLKEVLLNLRNANFLDHEHSDIPENRAYYTREELRMAEKHLAYGVVSSKSPRVESEEEVASLARDAYERYGDRLLFLKPDCGFGGLRGYLSGREYEDIVLKKLAVLVKVASELPSEV
uniref:Cobalamin-independent methionine synthase MetE C-terminal/archaeal domain-containing protein n=1 Tax=Thermofilum pendens TaxID=2269 RepID=A0A7J3X5W8_THEPE